MIILHIHVVQISLKVNDFYPHSHSGRCSALGFYDNLIDYYHVVNIYSIINVINMEAHFCPEKDKIDTNNLKEICYRNSTSLDGKSGLI